MPRWRSKMLDAFKEQPTMLFVIIVVVLIILGNVGC